LILLNMYSMDFTKKIIHCCCLMSIQYFSQYYKVKGTIFFKKDYFRICSKLRLVELVVWHLKSNFLAFKFAKTYYKLSNMRFEIWFLPFINILILLNMYSMDFTKKIIHCCCLMTWNLHLPKAALWRIFKKKKLLAVHYKALHFCNFSESLFTENEI
jgi:hypothetical protein